MSYKIYYSEASEFRGIVPGQFKNDIGLARGNRIDRLNTVNFTNRVEASDIAYNDGGIDIDFIPKSMHKVQDNTKVLSPKGSISIIIKSLSGDGIHTINAIRNLEPKRALYALKDRVYGRTRENCDLETTYDRSKTFRHFIHMLMKGLIGCSGCFDKSINKVYIIGDGEDNRDIMDFGGAKVYRGIPAITEFSKEAIDNVGSVFNRDIVASETSLYNTLLASSGYVPKKVKNKVTSADKTFEANFNKHLFAGMSDLQVANQIVASEDPKAMMSFVAKHLPDRADSIKNIVQKAN